MMEPGKSSRAPLRPPKKLNGEETFEVPYRPPSKTRFIPESYNLREEQEALRNELKTLKIENDKLRSLDSSMLSLPPPAPPAGRGRGKLAGNESQIIGSAKQPPPKPLRQPLDQLKRPPPPPKKDIMLQLVEENGDSKRFEDAVESSDQADLKLAAITDEIGPNDVSPVKSLIEFWNNNNNVSPGEDEKKSVKSGKKKVPELDLADYWRKMPHSDDRYLDTEKVLEIKKLERPIGITFMKKSRQIVISEQGKNEVKMYDIQGNWVKTLRPGRAFYKPSDLTTLPNDHLAVRDSMGIQIFDESGNFSHHLCESYLGTVFGLTTDVEGNIITINSNNPRFRRAATTNNPTLPGEFDVLIMDPVKNEVTRRIELDDVISKKKDSKCRFLHCEHDMKKLFIVDLGLNQIYNLSLKDMTTRSFGSPGKGNGQFIDPAGLVTDSVGNIILADAGNHRLQMYDSSKRFVGMVRIRGGLKRPSGLFLDREEAALYVLNLKGSSMVKYLLKKN